MREVFAMWRNTRMVVLTAMIASLYAAILIPFKVLPLIPGVTELRPANAVPVVCSFLFGPAAAWGAAIGNVIGDFFGGLGPGDVFGFAGNFLYGLIPYKAWRALTDADPLPRSLPSWIGFVGVVVLSAGACAVTIGWGLNLLGFVPFALLGNIILLNNGIVAAVLSPLLLATLYPRVKRARLRYEDIMPALSPRRRSTRRLGLVLVVVATIAGLVVGNLISTGQLALPFLAAGAGGTRAAQVGFGLLPIIVLLLIGAALL
jgi:energy-coupling factor transport system substrate-specific component